MQLIAGIQLLVCVYLSLCVFVFVFLSFWHGRCNLSASSGGGRSTVGWWRIRAVWTCNLTVCNTPANVDFCVFVFLYLCICVVVYLQKITQDCLAAVGSASTESASKIWQTKEASLLQQMVLVSHNTGIKTNVIVFCICVCVFVYLQETRVGASGAR